MKYKKILPLILVLMLVFTLTACDNWQRGIDEVQDADGPSWDLDLSVPLLPETNVPVGEELASFLDVEDEIEDLVIKPKYVLDEEDLDDQDRYILLEETRFGDELDFSDLDFEDIDEEIDLDDSDDFDMSEIDDLIDELAEDFSFTELIELPDTDDFDFEIEDIEETFDIDLDIFDDFANPDDIDLPDTGLDDIQDEIGKEVTVEIDDFDAPDFEDVSDELEVDDDIEITIPAVNYGDGEEIDLGDIADFDAFAEEFKFELDDDIKAVYFEKGEIKINLENNIVGEVKLTIQLMEDNNNGDPLLEDDTGWIGENDLEDADATLDFSELDDGLPQNTYINFIIKVEGGHRGADDNTITLSTDTDEDPEDFKIEKIVLNEVVEVAGSIDVEFDDLDDIDNFKLSGDISIELEAGVLDDYLDEEYTLKIIDDKDHEKEISFEFKNKEIKEGYKIRIEYTLTTDTILELGENDDITIKPDAELSVGKVTLEDEKEINEVEEVELGIDDEFSDNVKEIKLKDGKIEIDDGGLGLTRGKAEEKDIRVRVDETWLEYREYQDEDGGYFDLSVTIEDAYDKENIEIEIDIEFISFQYPDGNEDEDEGFEIDITIDDDELDWTVTVEDFDMTDGGIDLLDFDIEFDDEDVDIDYILFDGGIGFDIDFDSDEYEIKIKIKDGDDKFDTTITEDDGEKEIDLTGEELSPDAKLYATLIKGDISKPDDNGDNTGITLSVSIDLDDLNIEEVKFEEALGFEDDFKIDLEDLPEDISSIQFAEGIIQVELKEPDIQAQNVSNITFEDLYLKLPDGTKRDFEEVNDNGNNDNRLFELDLTDDIKLERDNDEWSNMEVIINAAMDKIQPDQGDIEIDVSIKDDLIPGKIELAEEAFGYSESISISEDLDDLADYLEDIEYIDFSEGELEILIFDGNLELEYDLNLSVNEEVLTPDEDTEEKEGKIYDRFTYDLTEEAIEIEDDFVIDIDFIVESLVYQPGPPDNNQQNANNKYRQPIEIKAGLSELKWEEIKLNPTNLLDEFAEGDSLFEDEDIEIGLGEYRQLSENVKFSRDQVFQIFMSNTSEIKIDLEKLSIIALDEDKEPLLDENDEELIREFDFSIPKGEQDFDVLEDNLDYIFDILESFPEYIRITGGDLTSSEDPVILKADDNLSSQLDFEIQLSFELKANQDDKFVYEGDPVAFDLDEDTRNTIGDNIKEVVLFQQILNGLPLEGEVRFGIQSYNFDDPDNPTDAEIESFYGSLEFLRDEAIKLRKKNEKYIHKTQLDEEFIEKLKEDNLYIGYQISIPAGEEIRFSIEDYIDLKMWTNIVVRVNSRD